MSEGVRKREIVGRLDCVTQVVRLFFGSTKLAVVVFTHEKAKSEDGNCRCIKLSS